jgi:hypothetical protein
MLLDQIDLWRYAVHWTSLASLLIDQRANCVDRLSLSNVAARRRIAPGAIAPQVSWQFDISTMDAPAPNLNIIQLLPRLLLLIHPFLPLIWACPR